MTARSLAREMTMRGWNRPLRSAIAKTETVCPLMENIRSFTRAPNAENDNVDIKQSR